MIEFNSYPAVAEIVKTTLEVWPEHRKYLDLRFKDPSEADLPTAEAVAKITLALAAIIEGGLRKICLDYRYLCEELILPEELYFRRNGRYRLSSFSDAFEQVYSNAALMQRYMNGVLLSNIFWQNHAHTVRYFRDSYLPRLPRNMEHLEIGPGHGMFLYFATEHGREGRITGWDVSETSIAHTRLALKVMGVEGAVRLELGNLFQTDIERLPRYDSIVLGEVLEHLEDPVAALTSIRQFLKPGGLAFINVPANSPAPDHIYLIEEPQQALDLVASAGLEIVDRAFFPMTGTTLERAIKQKRSVSCVVIARRPT